MNGRKAKVLRRTITGDPDLKGRVFADKENRGTHINHPMSERAQYQKAKKEARK